MLECVQRRATWITFGRVSPSYKERLEIGNLITFQQRRLRGDLILSFRIIKDNFGDLNQDSRLRGHSLKLQKEIQNHCELSNQQAGGHGDPVLIIDRQPMMHYYS
ncbi:unnamed protein product [Psylliodes chrysocephalus]|uniref:Uncharacterized protein n=1 Tax=Psylliodes chrysocephalus TaxID=3402493 RepID=A0A9P0GLP5_9CUCU|nr:unnamed protein product [Psylliodes chrysocephala]